MEPERLEPTFAERLGASAELLGEAQAAEAGVDAPTAAETRKQTLRERQTPGDRWRSGNQRRHSTKLWGDSVPLRIHGEAPTRGRGQFRGRDCLG
jgi:hypothetical protein